MKKWFSKCTKMLLIASLLATGATFAACFSDNGGSDNSSTDSSSELPANPYEVAVSMSEWTMYVYEDITLTATVTNNGETTDESVVWSSSDASVATVEGGKVTALKAGTVTITATAQEAVGTCTVTVLTADSAPQVVIDAEESLQIRAGNTFQVAPSVLYNSNTYTDATFTYSSSNKAVFDVSESGLITAVAEGEAELTVAASWRGLEGIELTESITVKVVNDIQIELTNTEANTIYTSNVDLGDGKTYATTVTYGYTILKNGQEIVGAEGVTWASSNENVATVDAQTGVVTAVGVGETAITLSYVSETGKTYTSEEILLTVALPTVEKDIEIVMGVNNTENPLAGSDVFANEANQTIVSVVDITDGVETEVPYADGKVSGVAEEGTRKWLISNGEYGYIVNVHVATYAIRTAEDLAIFHYSTKTTLFTGNYVLANDIDASEYVHHQNIGWGNYNTGLTGTFDGRGHTIDGITLRQGGLFGVINSNSVVKNVAFTNVTLWDNGGTDNNVYTLASFIGTTAKVENLFVSIKAWPSKADRTTAALMSQYKVAAEGETPALFKNVVVVAPAPTQTMANARAVLATYAVANAKFENVYVLSPVQGFKDSDTLDGVTKYATVSDFETNVNVSELGLGDIWDLTGAYPVFKSSAKVSPYTLTMDQTTAKVYCEKTLTLTATAQDMFGNDASSKIVWDSNDKTVATVENGVVSALKIGTTTITATLGSLSVSCEVTVEEMPEEVNVVVNASNAATLYTTDKDIGDGKTYVKSATYTATATLNGEAIASGLVWASDNVDVLTIDATTGLATVVGVGTANITVSYTGESGTTYVSEKFAVAVEMPAIETGKEIVFGSADAKNPIILSQFTENTEFAVSGILNAADNTAIAYDATENNITATLTEGKYVWIVNNGEYGYKVNVWVATNAIRTAEDLAVFSVPDKYTYLEGTYVLANDIDASEYTHKFNIGWSGAANGLTGTFDGRGYTIDGITIRQGGLFGVINNGTVKNVALTNVKFSAADDNGGTTGNHLYVFATLCWYNVKIENVYVEIDSWAATTKMTTAVLFHSVKKAPPSINNVMIVTPAATGSEATIAPVVCNAGNATFTNVYVISPVTGTAITGVTQYSDVLSFEKNVNVSELGFGDVWDLTGAYPVFKSSAKVAPYTLTMDQTTANVYCNKTLTLTATAKDIIGNDVSSSLVWTTSDNTVAAVENGVVSALKIGTTTITATLGNLSVSCVVTVEEMPEEVNLAVGTDNVATLYTTDKDLGDGKTYVKSATYTAMATLNGEAIANGLVWASDNTDVLTIDATTGTATVVGVGTANVTVSYTGESGATYTSEKFAVTVEMPAIETGKEIVFGAADAANPVVVSQFTDNTEFAVSGILNAADNTAIAYDATANNVTATLVEGNYVWVVHNGEYGYKVNVLVATNAIRKATDLAMFSVPVGDKTTVYAGTYVLANDIDASEYVHNFNNGWSSGWNGLTGTFDGRGHTIDGITIRQGGLFAVISAGTVKNVAFTNVKFSALDDNGEATGNHLYVLATLLNHATTITDVYVEIDAWAETAGMYTAALFNKVNNTKWGKPTVSNVVVVTPAATGSETSIQPALITDTNITFTNVYVISPVTGTEITGVTQYSDVDTFKANVTTSTLTGFNSYWDLTGDYPIIATAKSYLA